MKSEYKIYTAGKMKDLSYAEQVHWRMKMEKLIKENTDKNVTFIHPPLYYNYEQKDYKSEREVKEWEINHLIKSDIVIVNLEGINDSVGTHYELSAVDTINRLSNKHIYIIGFGESSTPLHPWIELSLFRKEHDYYDAVKYITEYLLI